MREHSQCSEGRRETKRDTSRPASRPPGCDPRGRPAYHLNRSAARPHCSWEERTMATTASGPTDRMKALVQDGSGSADVLHLREIEMPAITDDGVLVKV